MSGSQAGARLKNWLTTWPISGALAVFVLVFCVNAYFSGSHGWNQNSRVDAIFNFVEPGPTRFTYQIDRFIDATERGVATDDWAIHDNHHYPNKAPGTHVLGTPAYLALYAMESALGADVTSRGVTRINCYLLNLWCSVLWTALASAVFLLFVAASGARPLWSILLPIVFAVGTLVLPFGTSIWGHSTSAAFLLMAACLLLWPGGCRNPAIGGLCAGLAIMMEYTAAIPVAALGIVLLARRDRHSLMRFLAGFALPMVSLLVYQKLCFGGFLTTPLVKENPIYVTQGKFIGILGIPDLSALPTLLFSSYRGLLAFCPVLAFALPGAVIAWRQGKKALVAVAACSSLGVLLLIMSFNAWWGGWSTGPRYLIVSIPFWCLLLPEPARLPAIARWAYFAAIAFSIFNMVAISAVEPMTDPADRNPLYGTIYRLLLEGRYPIDPRTFNLGTACLDLPPRWDLVPLAVLALLWLGWLLTRAGLPRQER